MLNPHAYRGRHEPAPIWLEDDSQRPKTKDEIIEGLRDELKHTQSAIEELKKELKRERAACEYWRLLYEGVKK